MIWLYPAAAVAQSKEFKADRVQIVDAWAPPTIGTLRTGVVYFTLINSGGGEDRLLGLTAEGAGWAALHESKRDGDVIKMRPLDGLSIPPGATIRLKPGGKHVMLFDVVEPLVPGRKLLLQLEFARMGKVSVEATIQEDAPQADHSGH